jgi:hypothetical protein
VFSQWWELFPQKDRRNNYIYIFTKSEIITKILLWTEASSSSYSENQKLWIVSSTNFFVLYESDAAQNMCSVRSSNLHGHCVPDKPIFIWSMLQKGGCLVIIGGAILQLRFPAKLNAED